MNKKIEITEERISANEYIDFLKRTDLGSQYPKERLFDPGLYRTSKCPFALSCARLADKRLRCVTECGTRLCSASSAIGSAEQRGHGVLSLGNGRCVFSC